MRAVPHSLPAADLVDDGSHELWVRLLIGQKLPDDLVHDVLRREEVVQKLGQDPGHDPGFAGQALPDPGSEREFPSGRKKKKAQNQLKQEPRP